MKAWIRRLEVTLTSTRFKKKMVFGQEHLLGRDDLYIDVVGYKYMSFLKDACTIKIKNLTYAEVIQIIQGQFYDVKVDAGYRDGAFQTIFDGAVAYISNQVDDRKSNTIIIICTSKLVAQYSQKRLNLTLNSGINLYSAINFVCKRAAIPNTNVSERFKTQFLSNIESVDNTAAGFLETLASNNVSFVGSSDSSLSNSLSIYDSKKKFDRYINLNSSNIILSQYPQMNTDKSISLSLMPTLNLRCGDVIKIDNSLISIPVRDKSDITQNYGYFLDEDGYYVIFQMSYHLQNRGSQFKFDLTCKSRELFSNLLGEV